MTNPYATPRTVQRIEDCWFYHTIDVPGLGVQEGPWDLREGIVDYLGGVALAGRRVIDVGTATGFLAFHMEKQGAEVVSYDICEELARCQNLVPFATVDVEELFRQREGFLRQMNNAFWLCHEKLGSEVRVVYGDVYDVPESIGPVDVATFGAILLHLRDPFRALASVLRLVRDEVVITEPDWHPLRMGPPADPALGGWRRRVAAKVDHWLGNPLSKGQPTPPNLGELPVMSFVPDHRTGTPQDGWWLLTPKVLQEFVGVLGFGDSKVIYHTQLHQGQPTQCFSIVAKRTAGGPGSGRDARAEPAVLPAGEGGQLRPRFP